MCPTDEYYQDFRGESIPIYEQAGVALSLSDVKSVSKVLGKMSDSRTSYIASVTISASANNFLS